MEIPRNQVDEKMFFTSDTHFGHKLMARERGFCGDTEAMNEKLINKWNSTVNERDIVYHLGDFSFMNKEKTLWVIHRLNGRIRFIRGNHDSVVKGPVKSSFEWEKTYYECKVAGGQLIVLSHYPLLVWNKAHYGSWHLHGHCHGSLTCNKGSKRMDVGVDTNDLKPYSLSEVAKVMDKGKYKAVDHHTKRGKNAI